MRPRKLLLGVTGGIAAYKAPAIVRRLCEQGFDVRCVMTRAAESFVTPLSLEVVSEAPTYRQSYLEANDSGRELHIEAAQWADTVCVAPATANFLSKYALGLADDFLLTSLLAFDGPVLVAPAMHPKMWAQPAVQAHVAALGRRRVRFLGPVTGELASGEVGVGRMLEPEEIAAEVVQHLGRKGLLEGSRVLVSAGGTREAIDAVRFLSSRSSGKMGFAVASIAAAEGAEVVLVTGPVGLDTPPGVDRIDVVSAAEMARTVWEQATSCDVVVMAAAVSDLRPASPVDHKIKKAEAPHQLQLEPTQDILGGLRDLVPDALLVGFAAETENLEGHARAKLDAKKLDLIVANDVSRDDIGFGSDNNEVVILSSDGTSQEVPKAAKEEVARRIIEVIAERLGSKLGKVISISG
jgi:phosphopantothenoylcysteine decarboxylase/phosphopantothenate--cysteine ligase